MLYTTVLVVGHPVYWVVVCRYSMIRQPPEPYKGFVHKAPDNRKLDSARSVFSIWAAPTRSSRSLQQHQSRLHPPARRRDDAEPPHLHQEDDATDLLGGEGHDLITVGLPASLVFDAYRRCGRRWSRRGPRTRKRHPRLAPTGTPIPPSTL